MDMSLIPKPGANGQVLVVKTFTNSGGTWAGRDVQEALADGEHAYSYKYFGANNRYHQVVAYSARKYLQEAGGYLWIRSPIAEQVDTLAQRDHEQGEEKLRKETEFILREAAKYKSSTKLDIWVKAQSAKTNPKSNSKVKHYTKNQIYDVISKDKECMDSRGACTEGHRQAASIHDFVDAIDDHFVGIPLFEFI